MPFSNFTAPACQLVSCHYLISPCKSWITSENIGYKFHFIFWVKYLYPAFKDLDLHTINRLAWISVKYQIHNLNTHVSLLVEAKN